MCLNVEFPGLMMDLNVDLKIFVNYSYHYLISHTMCDHRHTNTAGHCLRA